MNSLLLLPVSCTMMLFSLPVPFLSPSDCKLMCTASYQRIPTNAASSYYLLFPYPIMRLFDDDIWTFHLFLFNWAARRERNLASGGRKIKTCCLTNTKSCWTLPLLILLSARFSFSSSRESKNHLSPWLNCTAGGVIASINELSAL